MTNGAAASPPPVEQGQFFSEALRAYVDLAVKNKGWHGQSKAQNEATFAMFLQVGGDLPVKAYTRRHPSDFYSLLRGLPALYSKDKRWRDLPLKDIPEASKGDTGQRLSMKQSFGTSRRWVASSLTPSATS